MRGGGAFASKKLLAAFAVLAVAFVVLAALPAVVTDSDAADGVTPSYKEGVIVAGYAKDAKLAADLINPITGNTLTTDTVAGSTVFMVFHVDAGKYNKVEYSRSVNGTEVTTPAASQPQVKNDGTFGANTVYYMFTVQSGIDTTANADCIDADWSKDNTYTLTVKLTGPNNASKTITADVKGETVTLYQDVTMAVSAPIVAEKGSNVVLNLNDNKLTINNSSTSANRTITVDEGASLKIVGKDKKASILEINAKADNFNSIIGVGTNASVTMEKVSYTATGAAFFPAANASSVTIIDSDVKAPVYIVGTNNKLLNHDGTGVKIRISGSTLTGLNDGATPVYINAKGIKLDISGSTITGGNHAVMVRAGEATITDSNLVSKNDGNEPTSWGQGNTVTPATLLVGNKSSGDAYSGIAKVTVTGGSITAITGNAVATTAFDSTGKTSVDLSITSKIVCGTGDKSVSIDVSDLKYTATSEKNPASPLLVKCGSVALSGTINSLTVVDGDATVSDDFTIVSPGKLVVSSGATLTIASGKTLIVNSGATMSVAGTVNGAVTNNGTIEVQTGADVSGMTKSGNGTLVDKTSESEMSEMKISGTSETFVGTEATVFGAKQLITVDGSWTLVNGTNIFIKGMLIVPEGATLTIEAGATITIDNGAVAQIDGTLVIQPADDGKDNAAKFVVRSGTLELNGAADIKGGLDVQAGSAIAGKAVVGQDAAVVVTSDGVLTIASGASFEVQKSAVLTINGQATGAFDNYGTIVYDAQTENTGAATINMLASGAVVDVKAYTANTTGGVITITDADLAITKDGKNPVKVSAIEKAKVNKIEISAVPGTDSVATVGGFTVVEDASSKATAATTTKGYGLYEDASGNKTLNVNKTEIAGDLTVSSSLTDDATGTTSSATAKLNVVTGEKISFPGTTVVSLGFTVQLASDVKADVSGSIDATAKSTSSASQATFTNNGAVTVSGDGIVKINKPELTGTVNAVQYETGSTDKVLNYVTIDKAIATVSADGSTVKALNALGTNTVKTTAELPANVTLTVDADAKVSIGSSAGDDVVLTIANGATVKNNGAITVNGVLYAVNKTNVKGNTPVSDVYSEQTENGKTVREGWAKWTNIVTALSEAQSGETITISKEATADGKQQYVEIKGSTEIKSGVTLVVPSDKASLKLADGVTLTVSGTLTTAVDIYANTVFAVEAKNLQNDKSSAIVVKGVLNFDVAGAQGFKHSTATVPASGSTAIAYSALSKGAPIAGAYYLTDDHQVISTLEIALTAANDEIYIRGAVTAGDITFAANDDLKQLVVGYGLSSTGTTSATVKVDTVLTVSSLTLVDRAELVLEDLSSTTSNPIGSFTGSVVVGDASVAVVGGSSGNVAATFTEKDGKLLLSGEIDLNDKGDALTVAAGTVYANGLVQTTGAGVEDVAFSIAEGAVLSVEKLTSTSAGLDADELAVYGSLLVVNEASVLIDELVVVGTVSISATTASAAAGNLSVGDLYVGLSDDLTTGAAATFNGAFTLTGYAYIADGAVLDDAASAVLSADDVKKSAFYVEDKLWFTVYSKVVGANIDYITETYVEDAKLVGWMDVKGKVLPNTFASTATSPADITLGEDNEKLTAVLDKRIFEISVIADAGIENIAIDGNILSSDGSNEYVTKLAAGSHTVSYTLKNGYSGTATLTVNGEKQSGLTFSTVSGVYEYELQLSGVSASGYTPVAPVTPSEDKDDGLTITDYLLIVLVVLIVIMAVIVAMRLMRS